MGDPDYIPYSDRLRNEGRIAGREEGIEYIVKTALSKGKTPEEISDFNGIEMETILEIKSKMEKFII